MSARVRIQAPERERRTHAERTAETRARIMRAVVDSIADVGYPKTTAAEIARRAGVTWGAVQHHFGDKDGILMAVLEESFNRFAEHLSAAPPEDETLEKRVALFVERSWEHFASPHYRSTFEILLNLPDDLELSWQGEVLNTWNRIWSRFFPPVALSKGRLRGVAAAGRLGGSAPAGRLGERHALDLMHYTISVLSGLAATNLLEGETAGARERELGFLKDTLVRELSRADPTE